MIYRRGILIAIGGAVVCLLWSCSSDNNPPGPDLPAGDTTAPAIASTFPAAGDTGVALDPIIRAVFSEPIDTGSITTATATINGQTGQVTKLGSEIRLRPARLKNDSLYQVRILGTVTDSVGNSMGRDFVFSFRTTASIRGNYTGYYTGIKYDTAAKLPDTSVQPIFFSFGDSSYSIRINIDNPPIDTTFKIGKGEGTYRLNPDTANFTAVAYGPDTEAGFTSWNSNWEIHGPPDSLRRFALGDSVEFVFKNFAPNYLEKRLVLGRF